MHSDEIYRAFLLGTADRETESAVEEGLLDGSADSERLLQIESELIDDHLFGHLSAMEESAFQANFLASPERIEKLKFARALQRYALQSHPAPAPAPERSSLLARLRAWAPMPWVLPLAGALGCVALSALWLGERNRSLGNDLALATHTNSELRQTLAEREDELRRPAIAPKPVQAPPAIAPPAQPAPQPAFHLAPGVSRGLSTVPVFRIAANASVATIVLELPFEPTSKLSEELRDSDDQPIWRQEFYATAGIAHDGVTTVVLPAALLTTGEYRLRVEASRPGEERPAATTYVFRIRKG